MRYRPCLEQRTKFEQFLATYGIAMGAPSIEKINLTDIHSERIALADRYIIAGKKLLNTCIIF